MTSRDGSPAARAYPSATNQDGFLSFFEAIQNRFERTAARAGIIGDFFCRIAGRLIRMRFASSAMVSALTPALNHLAVPPQDGADLTVCLFESAAGNVRLPPPPWSWDGIIARGDIPGCDQDRIRAAFQPGAGILSLFDRWHNRAIYWIDDARRIPFHESATPLRTILHWFMGDQGLQFIHGAAVGTASGGVLIAGRGGSGKSSTALACLLGGMGYAGDDCVLVDWLPVLSIRGLYGTAMLEPGQATRFPRLRPAIGNPVRPGDGKLMLLLQPFFPDRLLAGFPLRAVLLPRITGRSQTELKDASPPEVFAALAPGTIAMLPGAGERDFRDISRVLRQVPNYVLELGTGLNGISRAVARILDGA